MAEIPSSIEITKDLPQAIHVFLSAHGFSKISVLVDTNTSKFCYPLIREAFSEHQVIEIPAGEKHKELQSCVYIWEQMTQHRMDRKSLLINVGGGVIGDMGGFCAATFKRGLSFINIPTTLLAQVDASIGGKLGIDFQGYKNHIGVFKDPQRILITTKFLDTLPEKELRSGFAEVLKHALITDAGYWQKIHQYSWADQPWQQHIEHSIAVKHRIVSEDPLEKGSRKILNYGHTIGHAIERYYLSKPESLLHGEAIAIGIICEAFLSKEKTGLTGQSLDEITSSLLQWFGKVSLNNEALETVALNALQDKKNVDGAIKCTLLQQIGVAAFDVEISISDIVAALGYYQQQNA